MRVAYVCADAGVPVFGHKGCSVHVREMCSAMLEAGCEVSLFASRRGGEAPDRLKDVTVIDLPASVSVDPEIREREAIAANAQIRRDLTRSGPFDIVYERAALWSVAPMLYAAQTSAAGILELNAPLVDEQARYRTLVQPGVARTLLASSLRAARLVAAVSDEVASGARGLAGEAANVHVVPNGVDTRLFTPEPRGPRHDGFVVGFVGSLKPWHGLSTLVNAFAKIVSIVPHARLLIVGDGPERELIVQRMEHFRLASHLTITGAVPHEAVPDYLRRMDVAVAPYPALDDFYFSPLKLTEYMAAGLPVVASAIGQVTSLVHHDQTGVLFPPGDAASLARALQRLHADPLLRQRLGRAARTFVAERYTWVQALDRILSLAQVTGRQSTTSSALVLDAIPQVNDRVAPDARRLAP